MLLPIIKTWQEIGITLYLHDEQPAPADWEAYLPDDEITRAAAMGSRIRAHTFLCARVALRQHLAILMGVSSHDVPITVLESGKPVLAKDNIAFSLAHSHGRILIGIAPNAQSIGVDLQYMDPTTDIHKIAARLFSAEECAVIGATPAEQQRAAAFEMWCRFEARFKAGQAGLSASGQLAGGFSYAYEKV